MCEDTEQVALAVVCPRDAVRRRQAQPAGQIGTVCAYRDTGLHLLYILVEKTRASVAGRCLGPRLLGLRVCLPKAGQGLPQLSA
jgi:hypothetical protein